jgi:hypothetical protein
MKSTRASSASEWARSVSSLLASFRKITNNSALVTSYAFRGSRVIAPFFGAFFGIFTAGLGFVDFGGVTFLAMTYLL